MSHWRLIVYDCFSELKAGKILLMPGWSSGSHCNVFQL